jgi:hypothetical protein
MGTCVIKFYTERIAFTRICLPYVRIVMVCMRVSLVKLPFQTVMGWISGLECMLSGARGLLQPHPGRGDYPGHDTGHAYPVPKPLGGVTAQVPPGSG